MTFNMAEFECPFDLPARRRMTPAERSECDRMQYEGRYWTDAFGSRSYDAADRRGFAAGLWGRPESACPVREEHDGDTPWLRLAWQVGWARGAEERAERKAG